MGGAALIADRLLAAAAEDAVRRDTERTAALLAHADFARSPAVLERVAQFLGADVITLDADRRPLAATLPPARLEDLARAVAAAPPEGVQEIVFGGAPATLGTAAAGAGAVALVYPGHVLSERRGFTLLRIGAVALAGVAVGTAGSVLAARSVVRPVRDLARAAERIAAGDLEARLEAQTGDEIEVLGRVLAAMVASLREAERLAALGRLTAALAHEVRNPLTSAGMTLEIERERLADPRGREALGIVLRELRKLALFAEKLLAFARGPGAAALRPAPLAPVVEEVLALLASQLDHLGIRVERDFAPDLPDARLDPDLFRHVVLNLVQNAIEAMPSGGSLAIAIRAVSGGGLRLAVSDEGVGVAPEDAPRLFEPFFTRKQAGTGLGLAIARAIAEAHGGSIRYRPRAPRGSTFEVDLP